MPDTFDGLVLNMDQAIFDSLGVSATYTPPGDGDPVACVVVIDQGVRAYPDRPPAQVSERRRRISVRKAQVPAPQRGGVFTVGAPSIPQDYTVDGYVEGGRTDAFVAELWVL